MVFFNIMKWVPRSSLERRIAAATADYPIVMLVGPRQCGKSSLARRMAERRKGAYFDLEDPENPLRPDVAKAFLADLRGLVVMDEVQREPKLFALLRVLADRRPVRARFLLLGSASPALAKNASESLAGRVAQIEMAGFSLDEVGAANWKRRWSRGGLPPAYLAGTDEKSHDWRVHFIQSLLERDLPQLGVRVPAVAMRRFWMMLAHYHGQVWNAADLGRAMGVKEDTARHYLDILSGAYMVRQLPPWFENTGKRVVKAPKIYLRDTGLLHTLLNLRTIREVWSHPRLGFSWEGFAMEQVIGATEAEQDAYFYRTHAGAELDLLIVRGGKRYGFEFKFEDSPRPSRSMYVARDDLRLEHLWVVHPGKLSVPLTESISTLPLGQVCDAAEHMRG